MKTKLALAATGLLAVSLVSTNASAAEFTLVNLLPSAIINVQVSGDTVAAKSGTDLSGCWPNGQCVYNVDASIFKVISTLFDTPITLMNQAATATNSDVLKCYYSGSSGSCVRTCNWWAESDLNTGEPDDSCTPLGTQVIESIFGGGS